MARAQGGPGAKGVGEGVGEGVPCWAARRYPPQDVGPWVVAVQNLKAMGREGYLELSRRGRQAALAFVEGGRGERARFVHALEGLAAQDEGP